MSRAFAFVLSLGLLVAISHAQVLRDVSFDNIARPQPGEWPSYNGQLSAHRHSALDYINRVTCRRSRRYGPTKWARAGAQDDTASRRRTMYVAA